MSNKYNIVCLKRLFLLLLSLVDNALACYDGRFAATGYASLITPEYQKVVALYSHCLSLCSLNMECNGVTYDNMTSICYMSSQPMFLYVPGNDSSAWVKRASQDSVVVKTLTTTRAQGRNPSIRPAKYGNEYAGSKALDANPTTCTSSNAHATWPTSSILFFVNMVDIVSITGVKIWNYGLAPDCAVFADNLFHDVSIEVSETGAEWTQCAFQDGILPSTAEKFYPCIRGERMEGSYNGYYLQGSRVRLILTKHVDGIVNQMALADIEVHTFD